MLQNLTPFSLLWSFVKIDARTSPLWELHKQRKKINLLYGSVDEIPEQITKFERLADLPADYVVDVPDFQLSGTLLTLFKEITAPLKFRRQNDQAYSGHILHETGFYSRKPLFIVNDRLTRNSGFIAKIPLQDVRFVKIYSKLENLKRYFGVIGIGGIVYIEMMDDSYSLPDDIVFPEFLIQGLQMPLRYPIHIDQSFRIPQFKSRIFWDPNAVTDAEGQYNFNFFTSDDISTFEIEVVAHWPSDELIVGRKSFTVQLKSPK